MKDTTREAFVLRVRQEQWLVAGDVDIILAEMKVSAAELLPAIGEITPSELLFRLRAVTMKAFMRRMERYL